MMTKIYPRTGDKQTVYLNAVVKDPRIEVGDYTIYNDFVADPLLFEKNNVLYHYPCLLYTSDAADEEDSVNLGGRRIIKNKNKQKKKKT